MWPKVICCGKQTNKQTNKKTVNKQEISFCATTSNCQKLQFLKWPLEASSKSESILMELHNKIPKFTIQTNMFTE